MIHILIQIFQRPNLWLTANRKHTWQWQQQVNQLGVVTRHQVQLITEEVSSYLGNLGVAPQKQSEPDIKLSS